jgi:hypothetical protein
MAGFFFETSGNEFVGPVLTDVKMGQQPVNEQPDERNGNESDE